MKVKVATSKLTDSPYSTEFADAFLFEDSDAITQFKLALKDGHPSSFLVSGYRGAGKTSLVNKVKELLKQETLFISLSLAKYESYPVLLKKLIRQLYLGFVKTTEYNQRKNEVDGLVDKFSLLYERTFNEITETKKDESKSEKSFSIETTFNLKKIIPPIVLILLSVTDLAFSIFQIPYISYVIFTASVIWLGISTLDIKSKYSKNKTATAELLRKSLYDDEIAEYHLIEILSELKKSNLNVIIVFDELDKINSVEDVQKIIHELKSLLLSGLANFIVISGQGLYYQLEKSHTLDDPIISSLFSKTIHVPFLHYSSLKKYCLNLVENDEQKKDPILNNYFDALILKSGRVPRKLSNIIRNKIHWEQQSAYLIIDEENREFYEFEANILSIINKIVDGDLPKITEDEVLIDFFIAQIHLWLYKIQPFKGLPTQFTISEIIEVTKYKEENYPKNYINQLSSLCELFFDRLVEQNILNKTESAPEELVKYSWFDKNSLPNINDVTSKEITIEGNNVELPTSKYLSLFIDLEKYIRGIYVDLIDEATHQNTNLSIKQMFDKLVELGVFSASHGYSNRLANLIDVRNKLVHGKDIKDIDLEIMQKSEFEINRLKAELIEDYTFFVSKRFLQNYNVQKDEKSGFDFVANSDNHLIVFEVKYLQSGQPSSRNINEIFDKFSNYQQTTSLDSYYVLFFYQPNGRKSFDNFNKKFQDLVKKKHPELANKFFLFYTSEYRGDASSGRLETYLQQVLSKIEPNTPKIM
ncbi:MAG TPA: ATP-binding protein [Pyrinomonadaceae bacterium]